MSASSASNFSRLIKKNNLKLQKAPIIKKNNISFESQEITNSINIINQEINDICTNILNDISISIVNFIENNTGLIINTVSFESLELDNLENKININTSNIDLLENSLNNINIPNNFYSKLHIDLSFNSLKQEINNISNNYYDRLYIDNSLNFKVDKIDFNELSSNFNTFINQHDDSMVIDLSRDFYLIKPDIESNTALLNDLSNTININSIIINDISLRLAFIDEANFIENNSEIIINSLSFDSLIFDSLEDKIDENKKLIDELSNNMINPTLSTITRKSGNQLKSHLTLQRDVYIDPDYYIDINPINQNETIALFFKIGYIVSFNSEELISFFIYRGDCSLNQDSTDICGGILISKDCSLGSMYGVENHSIYINSVYDNIDQNTHNGNVRYKLFYKISKNLYATENNLFPSGILGYDDNLNNLITCQQYSNIDYTLSITDSGLEISGGIRLDYNFEIAKWNVENGLYVDKETKLNELIVDKKAIFNGELEIFDSVTVRNSLYVKDAVIFNNTLNVTDLVILESSLNVYNDAKFNKNVDIDRDLTVSGDIYASNIYTKNIVDETFSSMQDNIDIIDNCLNDLYPILTDLANIESHIVNYYTTKSQKLSENLPTYLTNKANIYIDPGYNLSITPLEKNQTIVITIKINYLISIESRQTISFYLYRGESYISQDGKSIIDGSLICQDLNIGSIYGSKNHNIYHNTCFDILEEVKEYKFKLYYKINSKYNIIDTHQGILGWNNNFDTNNYNMMIASHFTSSIDIYKNLVDLERIYSPIDLLNYVTSEIKGENLKTCLTKKANQYIDPDYKIEITPVRNPESNNRIIIITLKINYLISIESRQTISFYLYRGNSRLSQDKKSIIDGSLVSQDINIGSMYGSNSHNIYHNTIYDILPNDSVTQYKLYYKINSNTDNLNFNQGILGWENDYENNNHNLIIVQQQYTSLFNIVETSFNLIWGKVYELSNLNIENHLNSIDSSINTVKNNINDLSNVLSLVNIKNFSVTNIEPNKLPTYLTVNANKYIDPNYELRIRPISLKDQPIIITIKVNYFISVQARQTISFYLYKGDSYTNGYDIYNGTLVCQDLNIGNIHGTKNHSIYHTTCYDINSIINTNNDSQFIKYKLYYKINSKLNTLETPQGILGWNNNSKTDNYNLLIGQEYSYIRDDNLYNYDSNTIYKNPLIEEMNLLINNQANVINELSKRVKALENL